jgi:hypothetical protein
VSATLAVFIPQLGTVSETFIRRHVEDLLPGWTVAVARNSGPPFGGRWEARCPVLAIDRWALALPVRLARRAGVPEARLRDTAVRRFLRQHRSGSRWGNIWTSSWISFRCSTAWAFPTSSRDTESI